MDYKVAVPVVQSMGIGVEDIGQAVRFYEEHKDLIKSLISFFRGLFEHHANPAVVPAPPPVTLVVPPPPPAPPLTKTGDAGRIKGILRFVEKARRNAESGQRGELEDHARFLEIQAGANADDGSWLHCDATLFWEDESEIYPGDPRWAQVNKWAPNGCEVWLYYEWNGQSTLAGHHSEFVEPGSVEDNHGCNPTYKITGKGKFRYGFQYKRKDGTMLDTGLIGQGDVVDGEPFNIA